MDRGIKGIAWVRDLLVLGQVFSTGAIVGILQEPHNGGNLVGKHLVDIMPDLIVIEVEVVKHGAVVAEAAKDTIVSTLIRRDMFEQRINIYGQGVSHPPSTDRTSFCDDEGLRATHVLLMFVRSISSHRTKFSLRLRPW